MKKTHLMNFNLFFFSVLFLTSFSIFGQTTQGIAGFRNHLERQNGFEVNIQVNYEVRSGWDDIMLRTSFKATPARGGKRLYYLDGKMYDLVRLGIPIDYNKITFVDEAVLSVLIGGSSKNINVTYIEKTFTGGGVSLCRKLELNLEKCRKYREQLSGVIIDLVSVKLNTRDYDIEQKIREWLRKNNGGANSESGDNGNGIGSDIEGGNGNDKTDTTEKNNKTKRRRFDEIPDDEYIEPMDGKGRESKNEVGDSTAVANKKEADGAISNSEKDAEDLKKINTGEAQKEEDYDAKVDEYAQKQQLQEQKYAAATELSAAALLIHYYIGTVIYGLKNTNVAADYQNYCSNFNMRFGYGGSFVPITTSVEDVGSYTIDMNFGYEWAPIYSKNFGFSIFLDLAAGHSIFFTDFKLGASGGIKTHLGPIAYNYRQNWMKIFHNDWISSTSTSDEMEKFVYSYGRNEIGLTFINENFNVDALFLLQKDPNPNNEQKYLKGGRIELYKPNGIRFFAEYMQLKQRLGNDQTWVVSEDSPFLVSLGVLNSFNYFGDTYLNEYSGKYINKRLRKKRTFFISLNSKFTRGNMFIGEEGDSILQSNMDLDLQVLFEKEILLYDGLYGTVGGGISGSRGFKGDFVSHSKTTINSPFYSGFKYSSATFDIPIGVLYKVKTLDNYNVSFWSAFKTEFIIPMFYYNLEAKKRNNGEIIELSESQMKYFNNIKRKSYTMLQIGFGVEHYINLYSKMRWGIFYEFAPKSIFQEPVIYKPNGFIFKASMTL